MHCALRMLLYSFYLHLLPTQQLLISLSQWQANRLVYHGLNNLKYLRLYDLRIPSSYLVAHTCALQQIHLLSVSFSFVINDFVP